MALQQTTILQPPTNIPIVDAKGLISSAWRQYFNSQQQFLLKFQNVITVPSLTQNEINSLNIDSILAYGNPIVYNNTDQSFQGYVDGSWKTFTLT